MVGLRPQLSAWLCGWVVDIMKIGLHDAEMEHIKGKIFPNYALMKISAWHKAQRSEERRVGKECRL